ncbi:hypothetical protein M422DRAFT_247507 [Sphaerobolus stellatus SS14]|nr:hypothetical protein M422DRAFT_247507 [Sphaerobolus stellatus SS14]
MEAIDTIIAIIAFDSFRDVRNTPADTVTITSFSLLAKPSSSCLSASTPKGRGQKRKAEVTEAQIAPSKVRKTNVKSTVKNDSTNGSQYHALTFGNDIMMGMISGERRIVDEEYTCLYCGCRRAFLHPHFNEFLNKTTYLAPGRKRILRSSRE